MITPVTFPQYFLLDPASRSGTALVRHLITPITFPRCFVLDPAIRSGSASGSTAIPVRHKVCSVPYRYGAKDAHCAVPVLDAGARSRIAGSYFWTRHRSSTSFRDGIGTAHDNSSHFSPVLCAGTSTSGSSTFWEDLCRCNETVRKTAFFPEFSEHPSVLTTSL